MIITVHSESLRKTSSERSFTSTHFTNKYYEIAWSNNASYRTGNCMRITEI
jgi:hypothetical protein